MIDKTASDLISPTTFPSQLATDAEKASPDYGLRVGRAISYEWFRRDTNSCRFYSQWIEFHKLRLYARGEQPVQKYKDELAIDGDLSYLNLNWEPVPIIPKFVDIVVNGMSDRLFSIKAFAQDQLATDKRSSFKETIEKDMVARDILNQTQEQFGINAFNVDPGKLPETDKELDLHMQIEYKPGIEIAEEEAINTILEQNRYSDIKKRIEYDMMTLGVGMVKHNFLPGAGIKVDYVDPASVVYSYTESPTFEDCFYFGEIKQVHISEIIKIDPNITKEDLDKISKLSSLWFTQYNVIRPYRNTLFDRDVVSLLYFNYKTDKSFVFKKKFLDNGGTRVIRKDDTFNPPQGTEERFERVEKRIDVWYEGVMVLGSSYLLKWELSKNMVRPKSATQYALPNYVAMAPRMYKGVIESLTRRMITFADLIQITHLKLQQVIARVVPDGVYIDADGMNEVDLGNGAAYNPEDALKLYFQTGSVIGRSYNQDGEYNQGKVPIQELNSNSGQGKITALINSYNHYLSMIRDVTGLNEARDGSMPDPRSLVGVQKLAALNSNTATRHILDGTLFITKRLAEALSCRISDVLEYSDFKDELINQIGRVNVSILEDIKDLYLHDFGIFIEVSPDAEEKAQLEANIQAALSRDQIDLEDAIDIREIKNIKIANELLKLKRKKKQQQDMDNEKQKMEMQTQSNIQSSQAAAQSKMEQLQAEYQGKAQLKQAESAFEIEKMKQEAQLKVQLMQMEFDLQMQLESAKVGAIQQVDSKKEEAKDKRVKMQSTYQSKMIDQRKKDTPPIDFESSEDSLDGFDFGQFEPQ
jgi:hypothetical protein